MEKGGMPYQDIFDALHCCVIVPTFNNEASLANVISDILRYSPNVIIVDDGSTDSTPDILNTFPQISSIRLSVNRGKGYALRKGFEKAREMGYRYAISMDSDGQHFADDLPAFLI